MRDYFPKLPAMAVLTTKNNFMNTYGILNREDVHIDVSISEKGAKNYATRNGYKKVSIRYHNGYVVKLIAEKNSRGKWIKVN
jgi:hypothetical protein